MCERELREPGLTAEALPANAADPESLANALATLDSRLGSSEVLVYNAAALHPSTLDTLSPSQLVDDFKVILNRMPPHIPQLSNLSCLWEIWFT